MVPDIKHKKNSNDDPYVSIVIPTYKRPEKVIVAVNSVLHQTFENIEVIVVIDGKCNATSKALSLIKDSRLIIHELKHNAGQNAARNKGLSLSKGKYVALLDDDDEWLPDKLSIQVERCKNSTYTFPVAVCKAIARTPKGCYIWPRRFPSTGQHISEYLFRRTSLFAGEAFIQTSGLLFEKAILRYVNFEEKLKVHDDWQWILEVSNLNGAGFEFIDEPLYIYNCEQHESETSKTKWEQSLEWIQGHLTAETITKNAYSSFVMISVGSNLAKERKWNLFFLPLKLATAKGTPQFIDYILYIGFWIFPPHLRQVIRSIFLKK